MIHQSFRALAEDFDAIFFDSYGVLKTVGIAIPGGAETLATLSGMGKEIRVLTNDASRSQRQQADRFAHLGYAHIRSSDIITSGMMAKFYLREKAKSGVVGYIGTADSARYVLDAGCIALPVSAVSYEQELSALVFLDDEGFDWSQDLNKTVNLIRKQNMPVIVANSDLIYPTTNDQVNIATGGIAKLIEQVTGTNFLRFGKPDSQMFSYAYEDINRLTSIPKRKVLMVGDTLRTDIIGGNKFGLQTCLTLTGNTIERKYQADIQRAGIVPDFVVRSIGT